MLGVFKDKFWKVIKLYEKAEVVVLVPKGCWDCVPIEM